MPRKCYSNQLYCKKSYKTFAMQLEQVNFDWSMSVMAYKKGGPVQEMLGGPLINVLIKVAEASFSI